MLYILTGQDDFSRGEVLAEIKKGIGDPALLAANTTVLDGAQLTLEQLRSVCETLPFLSERRVVIIEGLLGRFEAKGKLARQRKSKIVANQPAEHKQWLDYLGSVPQSTSVVLVGMVVRPGK